MKKKEIKLLNKMVTLNEYRESLENQVYPLAIKLNEEETKKFLNSSQSFVFLNLNEEFKRLYSRTFDPNDRNLVRFYLNAYVLREKIANGEIFVNTFIDEIYQKKTIDYISESYGSDLDAPRIVFRRRPRVLFRQWDHYDESKDDITKGEDLLTMAFSLTLERRDK